MAERKIKMSQQTQVVGSQSRRDVLWNVQEPGDPYDIRKSMVAKLPGQNQFLGDEIEIVCLLQAAEIQRLNDFLETYKVKFKDVQRIQLDRHSYEVQIKELTQKVEEINSLRRQNSKLKDFVKGQEVQLQIMQNQLKALQKNFRGNLTNQDFNQIYGRAIDKINMLEDRNHELSKINQSLQNQINTFEAKLNAFEKAKSKEIDEMRYRLAQSVMGDRSKISQQQALNTFKDQIQGELRKLQGEIRRLQDVNEGKNREITMLKQQNTELQRHQRVMRSMTDLNQVSTIKQKYESQINTLSSQVVKLDSLLKASNQKYQSAVRENIQFQRSWIQLDLKIKDREAQLKNREEEILQLNDLIKRIEGSHLQQGSIQSLNIQSEYKIRQLNQEIELLSSKLSAQNQKQLQFKELDFKHSLEYGSKLQSLSQQNEDLKREILQTNQLKRQIAHLQSEKAVSFQQMERLREIINSKNSQPGNYRFLLSENQNLRSKLNQIEKSWMGRFQSELLKIKTESDKITSQYVQIKQNEYRSQVILLEKQIQRYQDLLRIKADSEDKSRIASYELQNKEKQLENQSNRAKSLEIALQNLRKENEELYKRMNQLNEDRSQNRFQYQLQELNRQLRSKDDEIITLRSKYLQGDQMNSKQLSELNKKLNQHLQHKLYLQNQNDQLRKKVNELIVSNSNVSNETASENSRLNLTVNVLREQKGQLENKNNQLTQELLFIRSKMDGEVSNKINYYEQTISNLTRELTETKRKEPENDIRIKQFREQNENLFNRYKQLSQTYQTLKRQMSQRDGMISNFESDVTKAISKYESSINELNRANQDMKRRQAQMDYLIKQKDDEIGRLNINFSKLNQESQQYRMKSKDYQITLNQKMEGEADKFKRYQNELEYLRQENEGLKKKLSETINELNKKIIQVNNLFPLINQNELLRKKMTSYDSSIQAYEGEVKKKFSIFEQNMEKLTKQNDDLRKKVIEGVDLTKKLNVESGDRTAYLTKELERVNNILILIERENEGLRKRSSELGDLGRSVAQIQNKLVIANQELERVNQNLRSKCEDYNKLQLKNRNLLMDLEAARKQQIQLETHFNQNGNEITRKINSYEQNIMALKRINAELQNKNQSFTLELSNYNSDIKVKGNELAVLRRQNEDYKRRFLQYDAGIKQIGVEVERKTLQYQSKIKMLNRQMEGLIAKLKESQSAWNQRGDQELKTKYTYQTSVSSLTRQNEELKRRIQEFALKIPEYQQKINYIIKQNEQLQYALKIKADELANSQAKLRHSLIETQQLKRQIVELQKSLTTKYESEVSQKTMNYQQSLTLFNKERQELNRKKVQYESRITALVSQIERLNQLVKVRSEEVQKTMIQTESYKQMTQRKLMSNENELTSMQSNHLKLINENETQRRYLQEYEINIRKLQGQFQRLQGIIDEQKKERQKLFEKNSILSEEIERLTKENKDLEIQTRDMRLRASEETSLQKRVSEHLALMVVLFAEIETLRKRIADKQKEVEYVRRASLSPHILKH